MARENSMPNPKLKEKEDSIFICKNIVTSEGEPTSEDTKNKTMLKPKKEEEKEEDKVKEKEKGPCGYCGKMGLRCRDYHSRLANEYVSSAGPCGYCDKIGHWMRDCPSLYCKILFHPYNPLLDPNIVPPRHMCFCEKGFCNVRRANNFTCRHYYTCPVKPESCGYFQCCDIVANSNLTPGTRTKMCVCERGLCKVLAFGGRLCYSCPDKSQTCGYSQWFDVATNEEVTRGAERVCECGAGPCSVSTVTRKFYNCPGNAQGVKCEFFQWCDDKSP